MASQCLSPNGLMQTRGTAPALAPADPTGAAALGACGPGACAEELSSVWFPCLDQVCVHRARVWWCVWQALGSVPFCVTLQVPC